jgi:hypothetical protein
MIDEKKMRMTTKTRLLSEWVLKKRTFVIYIRREGREEKKKK